MDYTYNGFRNRSTWLAKLWLENTSKEVLDIAVDLAKIDKELREDKTNWAGINYPAWRLRGNEKAAEELLVLRTACTKETGFSLSTVAWAEVFSAIISDI